MRYPIAFALLAMLCIASPAFADTGPPPADSFNADSSVYDASVQPSAPAPPAVVVVVPHVTEDPVGFLQRAWQLATSLQYGWLFVLILMGLVEVTRAPVVIQKMPWLATPLGAHLQAGMTAFIVSATAGGFANHALNASVLGASAVLAICAGLGWKVRGLGDTDATSQPSLKLPSKS